MTLLKNNPGIGIETANGINYLILNYWAKAYIVLVIIIPRPEGRG